MDLDTYGLKPGSYVTGEAMNKYLNGYIDHYDFRNKTKLGTAVRSAELLDGGAWLLRYAQQGSGEDITEVKLVTKKLVLATGTTSEPYMPYIPVMDSFDGPLFHSSKLGSHPNDLSSAKDVLVFGGSKSTADAVYLNAIYGRHVDWIIRATGKGPTWLASSYVSPAKLKFEKLATTRFLSFLSPALDHAAYPTIRRLLHNTRIGRAILRGFFGMINDEMTTVGKYNQHPETKKLLLKSNAFWWGTSVGLFTYPTDLFELMRKGLVNVPIADPESISPNMVHFSDGTKVIADVFICATRYKQTPTIKFLPASITNRIGILTPDPNNDKVIAADKEILHLFPELKDQPPAGENGLRERERASYTLYRGIVSPDFLASRNLACCGVAVSQRSFVTSHISALWTTAFFNDRLSATLPSQA